jgi:hypothetical protein
VAPGAALTILGAGTPAVEQGWVAPRYGCRVPAPVVSAAAEGRDAVFVTVLGTARARVTLEGRLLRVDDDAIALGDGPLDVALC